MAEKTIETGNIGNPYNVVNVTAPNGDIFYVPDAVDLGDGIFTNDTGRQEALALLTDLLSLHTNDQIVMLIDKIDVDSLSTTILPQAMKAAGIETIKLKIFDQFADNLVGFVEVMLPAAAISGFLLHQISLLQNEGRPYSRGDFFRRLGIAASELVGVGITLGGASVLYADDLGGYKRMIGDALMKSSTETAGNTLVLRSLKGAPTLQKEHLIEAIQAPDSTSGDTFGIKQTEADYTGNN